MAQSSEQLGVCSWSLHASDTADLVARVQATGVSKVQLALTAHREDAGAVAGVKDALGAAGITVVSGMFGTVGEDYSTPATIRETGGVVPDQHWEANLAIAKSVAAQAAAMGLSRVSTHAGFLPHEKSDPAFDKLIGRIVAIAEVFSAHGLTLLFETGQEAADTLLLFFEELDSRGATNTAVNFDPANMLLYDMDDPIEALRKLVSRTAQVHIKDATRPTAPGEWGEEVVVGTGQVDWAAFLGVLNDGGFTGDLIIEREAGETRVADITAAGTHLRGLM
jgi:sugar phosphate isomerase/epimerase